MIPEEVRKELGIDVGSKIRLRLEKGGTAGVPAAVVTKSIGPNEFIKFAGRRAEEGKPRQTGRTRFS